MRKFRLTIFFAITSMVIIAVAALIVNRIFGTLAEENLVRFVEDYTAQDALHIQSMIRDNASMPGMASAGATDSSDAMKDMPLALEFLTGPEGMLTRNFSMLTEGFKIVKFSLFDPNDRAVWSSDPGILSTSEHNILPYQKALAGEITSKLVRNHEVTDLTGVLRRLDIVETHIPLRETPSGPIIGTMEIFRDVARDISVQVDEERATILTITIATMGGLFLVLLGFILVSDLTIYQSSRREIASVENQLSERVKSEEQTKTSLREKEVLLKEIHRRVKNNPQIISSLLNIRARNTKDEATVEILKNSRDQVRSMALLHEKLYQSQDLAQHQIQ